MYSRYTVVNSILIELSCDVNRVDLLDLSVSECVVCYVQGVMCDLNQKTFPLRVVL